MHLRATPSTTLLIAAFAMVGTGDAVAAPKPLTSATKLETSATAPKPSPTISGATKIEASAPKVWAKDKMILDPKIDKQMRSIRPLSTAQRLDKARALGILQPDQGLRGTLVLSPRTPWLNAHTFFEANFAMMVRPNAGSDGIVTMAPGATQSSVTLHFRAAANTDYLIDCTTLRSGTYDIFMAWTGGLSRASATSSAGHLTFAAPDTNTVRDLTVQINVPSEHAMGRCEINAIR